MRGWGKFQLKGMLQQCKKTTSCGYSIVTPRSSWFRGVCVLSRFSCVLLFAALWTVAYRLLCPQDSPGKNTGVGCHALLRGTFLTQGLNLVSCVSCIAGRCFTSSATWTTRTLTKAQFNQSKQDTTAI